MKEKIIIAGSGRMALSIGDYFLEKGFSVTWVTENRQQLAVVLQRIGKTRKRLQKYFRKSLPAYQADCLLLGGKDTVATKFAAADIVIETTSELLEKKKKVISSLMEQMGGETIFLSNSSSFLPQTIHPRCVGAHFFYPVSLTVCVELIFQKKCENLTRERIVSFFRDSGIVTIIEDQTSSFIVNRLLLALQSRCFKALREGYPPVLVDRASSSQLLSMGQLTMMDTIGLDTLFHAIKQYKSFDVLGTVDFELIQSSLEELLNLGKQGKKNRDGLLMGSKLPWSEKKIDAGQIRALEDQLQKTLHQSCKTAVQRGFVSYDQLGVICGRVFHCDNFTELFPRL